jgi:hypothetical protein
MRTAKAIKRQDAPVLGFHPEDVGIIARIGHGKDAAAIGQQQQRGFDDFRAGRVHVEGFTTAGRQAEIRHFAKAAFSPLAKHRSLA